MGAFICDKIRVTCGGALDDPKGLLMTQTYGQKYLHLESKQKNKKELSN